MLVADPLTSSPGEMTAIDELNAIAEWVTLQRPLTDQYPAALPLIQSFEAWYGMLHEQFDNESRILGQYLGVSETNEAKRRRDAIKAALHKETPQNWPVASASPDVAPEASSPIETGIKYGIAAAVLLALYKIFS